MSFNSLKVVFENQHFVAIHKPAGMLSVPARDKSDPRLVAGLILGPQLLSGAINQTSQAIFPCHRLDYEVSGILLFAKNKDAHRAANMWFEKHLVRKTYHALTSSTATHFGKNPTVNPEDFKTPQIVRSKLVRGKKRAFEAEHGQPSETHIRFIGPIADSSFLYWELNPITGRSHQLRYELAKIGFPILGDTLYGSNIAALKANEIALTAIAIDFSLANNFPQFELPEKISINFQPPVQDYK